MAIHYSCDICAANVKTADDLVRLPKELGDDSVCNNCASKIYALVQALKETPKPEPKKKKPKKSKPKKNASRKK